MSDRDSKKFDPSQRRLDQARTEGNVPRSRDLVSVGVLMGGMATLAVGTPLAFRMLQETVARVLMASATTALSTTALLPLMAEMGLRVGLVISPFLLVIVLLVVGLNVMQSGWVTSTAALTPKGSRINPLEGFKRIFSARGLFDSLKALVKILIVAPLAYFAIRNRLPELMMLHTEPVQNIVRTAGSHLAAIFIQMILAMAVIAVADFAFEKWRHKRDLKMTLQEVKEETKDMEGNAEVKGKRRQIARERLRKPRLIDAVMKADVVITNPTHYAVALRYDAEEGNAPRVLVKGIRKRALRIKELAREHRIPTVEDRPLARALYAAVEEDQEIPVELYPAVAAVLAEIYRARGWRNQRRS